MNFGPFGFSDSTGFEDFFLHIENGKCLVRSDNFKARDIHRKTHINYLNSYWPYVTIQNCGCLFPADRAAFVLFLEPAHERFEVVLHRASAELFTGRLAQ